LSVDLGYQYLNAGKTGGALYGAGVINNGADSTSNIINTGVTAKKKIKLIAHEGFIGLRASF
jgi:hypothetical protein